MNDNLKAKAGLVYNVVESVILAMSVGLTVWLAHVVITHGETLARNGTEIQSGKERLSKIESTGSSSLIRHEADDNQRIAAVSQRLDKIEQAVLVLQNAAADLKAIAVRLENIQAGQARIEASLEQHKKESIK